MVRLHLIWYPTLLSPLEFVHGSRLCTRGSVEPSTSLEVDCCGKFFKRRLSTYSLSTIGAVDQTHEYLSLPTALLPRPLLSSRQQLCPSTLKWQQEGRLTKPTEVFSVSLWSALSFSPVSLLFQGLFFARYFHLGLQDLVCSSLVFRWLAWVSRSGEGDAHREPCARSAIQLFFT